jgi:hypothetical protein
MCLPVGRSSRQFTETHSQLLSAPRPSLLSGLHCLSFIATSSTQRCLCVHYSCYERARLRTHKHLVLPSQIPAAYRVQRPHVERYPASHGRTLFQSPAQISRWYSAANQVKVAASVDLARFGAIRAARHVLSAPRATGPAPATETNCP